jgi:hypothetical protein
MYRIIAQRITFILIPRDYPAKDLFTGEKEPTYILWKP